MKKKLLIFLSIASLIGIQAGQAYRIKCPAPESISVKQVGNQYEYSAKIKMDGDRDITMSSSHKENLDLSAFSFEVASSSSDNRLFCAYTDPKGGVLNLVASLKKGGTCTVTYPKGHKHPELSYFECKDEKESI